MDTTSEYPPTSTINLYNIHLQQQQQQQIRHQNHLHPYPQQQQQQQQFCDPSTSASEMMWENHHKKHAKSYILSPPQDEEYGYRQQYQPSHQMYYDKSPNSEFYQASTGLKTEDSPSLFIDSSIHRQPIMTMHAREDNTSQSSSNNTAPSTCSTIIDKKNDAKKQCTKDMNKSSMVNNRPVVEKKRYRRESHNAVERRRRNNINDNIKSLGQLLPENICEGKLNKGSILKGSVVYIHMLNEQLSKYKERLEILQYEAANISTTTTTSI